MTRHDTLRTPAARYSMRSALAFAERMADRARWYSSIGWGRARIAARAALADAGVPVRKEFLVMGCAQGEEASGLFSEVGAVLGGLHHYESAPGIYAGLRVDFSDQGLYYDANTGPNWWEYYFEPLTLGRADDATVRTVAIWQHDEFADKVERDLSRSDAAALLRRHVRVKSGLRDRVERYWRDHVKDARVIGIHYRGTDKAEESPAVAYESVSLAVRQAQRAAGTDHTRIFLATDEQAFLDYLLGLFPGQVLYRPMRRSVDGRPMHKCSSDGFRSGEDAVIDCLLLSRCAQLIRTDSNLGLFATLFNPDLPVTVLSAT